MLARFAERAQLDEVLIRIRDGHSAALLLEGVAGVGKSTLLKYAIDRAVGITLLSTTGTQSELELAYSGLHQLCRRLMGGMAQLPAPQREALETTFGLRAGPFPGKFMIGLAVLSLFSEASRIAPILCVVDDVQWLDQPSTEVLGFVARRLEAEAVGIVFAMRSSAGVPEIQGIPRMAVRGLEDAAAEELLASLVPIRIGPSAMKRIVDEAEGNPLTIVETARALDRAEIESGLFRTDVSSDPGRLEEQFARRLKALPDETQRLLLIAAADPAANALRIEEAAASAGVGRDALRPAVDAGLCRAGATVRFRHPLVRSAAYRSASPSALRAAHAALARIRSEDFDPGILAWHRACASEATDEDLATQLAAAAEHMLARGAPAASAILLAQARRVTADEKRAAEWSLRTAIAELAAGDFAAAARDLAASSPMLVDPRLKAEAKLTEARLAFARERGGMAVPLLLEAADLLMAFDPRAAQDAYLEAFSAALFGGTLTETDLAEVAARWQATKQPEGSGPARLLLDALSRIVAGEGPSAWQHLRKTLMAIEAHDASDVPPVPVLWVASVVAAAAWDMQAWDLLSRRLVAGSRHAGDYSELPPALSSRAFVDIFSGDVRTAVEAVREMETITSATGGTMSPYGAIGIAALTGTEADVDRLVEATIPHAERRSDASGVSLACWAQGLLNNSMGRYEKAFGWGVRALPLFQQLHASSVWALVELIEAASRTNRLQDARAALSQLASATEASGASWGLGVLARSRGLVSTGAQAEDYYSEALQHLDPTRCAVDFARTSLVYGEWLRRQRRLSDSRTQLDRAFQLFDAMGATAFGDRASNELRAAGAQIRTPRTAATSGLTTRESQIAQLVAQGLTNSEVASRMFLSPRTVEYHLAKVFGKLQLKSRHQLSALPPGTL